jgi:hypothetical protein
LETFMPDTVAPQAAQDYSSRLTTVTLDDKYTAKSGNIFLSGIQALVRLPMMQRERDGAAGLNTAGFVSGYRGSPLGGLDETWTSSASKKSPRQRKRCWCRCRRAWRRSSRSASNS